MTRRLTFENLPFHPRADEAIYFESYPHMAVNAALRHQWQHIDQAMRETCGLRFRYLPTLQLAATPNQLQWLKPDIKALPAPITTVELAEHLAPDSRRADLPPGVMLFSDSPYENVNGFWYAPLSGPLAATTLLGHVIDTTLRLQETINQAHLEADDRAKRKEAERKRKERERREAEWHKEYDPWIPRVEQLKAQNPALAELSFEELVDRCREQDMREQGYSEEEIQETLYPEYEMHSSFIRPINPNYVPDDTRADATYDDDVRQLLYEVQEKIEQLRLHGVSEMLLHQLVEPEITLSRMLVTKDFRIVLTDYDNLEISMTPLVKAVYFLFLRHTSGIRFKQLPDYRDELAAIYKLLRGGELSDKARRSIDDVTDPTNNSINEKCARIREAFLLKINENYATYYIITGEKNQPKRIDLYRNMLKWDDHKSITNIPLTQPAPCQISYMPPRPSPIRLGPESPQLDDKPKVRPAATWPEIGDDDDSLF